jgi:hypothetical protein
MKTIITILTLLTVNNSFSYESFDKEYITNDEGYTVYVGDCKLHEDWENKLYSVKEVVPYTSYPSADFVRSLTTVHQELIRAVYNEELGPYLDGDFWTDLNEFSFDDISIDEVTLSNSKEVLYRVSYGVGGGNGGYTTFRVKKNQKLEALSKTFDGELLSCSSEFM